MVKGILVARTVLGNLLIQIIFLEYVRGKRNLNIWSNIFVILVVIAVIITLLFVGKLLFEKYLLRITDFIGLKISLKIKKNKIITYLEVAYFALIILYVISCLLIVVFNKNQETYATQIFILTFLFMIILILLDTITEKYKELNPNYQYLISILKKHQTYRIVLNKLSNSYLINRIGLLLDQGIDFMKILLIYVLSINFLVILKWSDHFYFLFICFFPLYANYWVYYTKVITLNKNSEAVVVRRAFIYVLVMLAVTHEIYLKFQGYIYETNITINLETFFLSSSGILYIAIDRILKEIIADYLIFRDNQNSKQ